jgi:hypothetical protein
MNTFVSRFFSGFSSLMANFYGFLAQEVIPWVKLHKKGVWLTLSALSLAIAYLIGSNLRVYSLLTASLAASFIVYTNQVDASKKLLISFFTWLAKVSYDLLSKAVSWTVSKIVWLVTLLGNKVADALSGKHGLQLALVGWTVLLAVLGFSRILPKDQAMLAFAGSMIAFIALALTFLGKKVEASCKQSKKK